MDETDRDTCKTFGSRILKRATTALAPLLILGLLGTQAIAPACAADPTRTRQELRSTSTGPTESRPAAQRLADLSRIEDEGLTRHAAGEWSGAEVVLVILLLVFFFPVGVIVLIVLLITDGG